MSLDEASDIIDLSGPWRLCDANGDYACIMQVPGDGITALYEAGLIPDPYYGRNEYDLRWIAERDWVIEREVELSETNVTLMLSGLDCVTTIQVNGEEMLSTDSAFRPHSVDIDAAARFGPNTIGITFHSPLESAAKRAAKLPFPVPSMNDHPEMGAQCPIPGGNMLRKPACDFGWDWNIALCPFGVTDHLQVRPSRGPRLKCVRITQQHEQDTVKVHVVGTVANAGQQSAVTVSLAGEETTDALSGLGGFETTFTLPDPDLWWPNTLGDQPLHDLTIRCGDRTWTRRIGLCDIRLEAQPDEIGTSFAFIVNGHRHFARGANWIPADALPGRITPEKTRALLQSAKDANMTMIRVWGGGRYEADWFYDICDELGLMVWQDAMFACNLYPSDDAFLDDVEEEVRQNAERLSHHPCLALWCGDNELVGALNWFPESRENRDRYLASYDRLNRTVETAVTQGDPSANWWPSSPSRGHLDFGDGWHDDTSGDMHVWSVWHEGRDFDHYRDVAPRFCSEFGFQSYPSMHVIKTFTRPEDRNIASPVMESHQKNPGGNARIAETMFRYFRFPEGFGNFVYLSQVQQALAIKTAVSHWRAQKPRCMGTLYWQLNDTWPVASWSSLDYGGGWKLLHHAARDFYAPVFVTAIPNDDRITLTAVNDTRDPIILTVEAFTLALDGTESRLDAAEISVPTDRAAQALTVPTPGDGLMLLYRWTGPDGVTQTDHFAPRPYKAYDLQPSGLNLSHGDDAATLTAERPAFFAAIEADHPLSLPQNGALVLPDHPVTLPEFPDTALTLRDLHSATYGKSS